MVSAPVLAAAGLPARVHLALEVAAIGHVLKAQGGSRHYNLPSQSKYNI
jgi:hypothetical protein